jgi:hypothetical protein
MSLLAHLAKGNVSFCHHLASFRLSSVVRRPLTFHILIFSSVTPQPNVRFIWPSGFREEDFLEINQSETRIACGGHVC